MLFFIQEDPLKIKVIDNSKRNERKKNPPHKMFIKMLNKN